MAGTKKSVIYQLKVTLEEIRPPIWRRILVPSKIDLSELHLVVQIAMGWTNSHLHQFRFKEKMYGMLEDEMGMDLDLGLGIKDERKYKLSDLLKQEKDWLRYEYDFGDSWTHKVLLEKKLEEETGKQLPRCIKGKRACPPEDCGGVWGYQELLEVISDREHPEHEEMVDWLGGEFDPEELKLEEINRELADCS